MKFFTTVIVCVALLSNNLLAQSIIVPLGANWKYLDNGSNQGSAWRASSFDDSSWKSGYAMFGYDVTGVTTTVSYGPSRSSKYITTYFRKSINISDVSSYNSFTITAYRDDALIVYVNGTEVFRDNMPDGEITYTTYALKSSNSSSPKVRNIDTNAFVNGTNVIAVEVHQQKPTSSDLAFDMELSGELATPPSNQAPVANITSPLNNSSYMQGQTISITADASDPENAMSKVEFYVSGTKIGEDSSAPYAIDWTPATAGTYYLTAKAFDTGGQSGVSQSVGVTITPLPQPDLTPPTVISIVRQSPPSETTSSSIITFRATFSETVSGVDASDFTLSTISGSAVGVIGSGAVSPVGSEGDIYDVTVSSITGEGTIRLDLKSSGTNIVDTSNNPISGGFTGGESYIIQQSTGSGLGGFASINYNMSIPVSKHTADKPQSKVWKYAGKWWTVLPDDNGTHIWRLDGETWNRVLTLASTSTARADCKVVGNLVHVLLFRGSSTSYLLSAEYVSATNSYKLWSQRTARVSLNLESEAETATIEVDGSGRMWLANDGTSSVNVRWSDYPYSTWSNPIALATNIQDDDICGVIAMPGKIGVLWSNQNTERFGFKTHTDGASPTSWSSDEVPASQSAQQIGSGMADDHLNMAIASDGTLYCAIKTGYDTNGYTKLGLLIRRPNGSWDNMYKVTDTEGTRPIILLNEALGKLKIVYTSSEGGGDIIYKESSTSNISFGYRTVLFTGNYNYATSTKQTYSSDVVILVSNEGASTLLAESILAIDPSSNNLSSSSSSAAMAVNKAPALVNDLEVYPNPFLEEATLLFRLQKDEMYAISIFDSKGAKIQEIERAAGIAGEQYKVIIRGERLPKGLYFVRLQTGDQIKTLKLLHR